ncbi:hypothetical protein E2C01_077183 [Portunus trituberculatus]|uniref:Uncharacterized protein n=1 Tax=Portunus trituberculatus TaxID=210409 RepID=A0A5B7IAR0_PORTR|nr:hypothetical protein [Portunus trituberculatus]
MADIHSLYTNSHSLWERKKKQLRRKTTEAAASLPTTLAHEGRAQHTRHPWLAEGKRAWAGRHSRGGRGSEEAVKRGGL